MRHRVTAVGLALILIAGLAEARPAEDSTRPDSDAPWRVEDAHGPTRDITFTTDEGTWLSLDVHPDGRRLVFSLLGDLYLLPMEGGDAHRITSGTGYDVQPRFSPNGEWIAFASDRGGTENLWICDLEGQNARAISSEEDAFVNSPAWTPDGLYVVGRKRLTDTSSLGTVELWMWHVRGGKGIQLTKKDTQPDAADPAFSPDGRFLYFSARDSRFRYGRNPNPGIWQIKRLDRRTGQVVPITGEHGGAAAPTVSPDGQTIAFTRRVRARTRIELLDVATGRLRTLASNVQRDNQQGFAFHGVFPGFAWTPDGGSLVATAEGRIWRWDVETGARSPVPFEAAVQQRVAETLRFPQSLGAEAVRARILRWPVESPDGRHLVFQAVGHLYVMDLPDGTPRRLTASSDLEYAPAFSGDGSRLAFVTWNDETGGHVWTLPFGSGEAGAARRLTEVPGQYANPAFSPEGDKVVFVRGSGATFRDHDPAEELWHEIHWVDSTGGPSHYVIGTPNRGTNRRTTQPRFSRDGERIFYVENDPEGKPLEVPDTHLVSVKLDGTDHQAHLSLGAAEEASVSPDGNWVAFTQAHNAYVAAMPMLGGQTVEVAVDDGALPVSQLSDEGGEWVGWADGGRTVTWIFGPTYSRVGLDEALPVPEPALEAPGEKESEEDEDELPEADTIEIVLELPRARPEGVVAYTGARIVTMNGDEIIENGVLVVENDRIRAVGPASSVAVPKDASTVDVSGRTIIPGLFDEHAHLHYSTLDVFPERPWKYLANLAYGVTATHDPSASTHEVFGQAEMVEAGLMTGPRIFSTGFILYGAALPGRALVESLDDARRHVRRLKSLGAFSVKSYMQPRREQRQWIVQAAREEGVMVVPEGGGDLEADMTMILDGHTTIEHSLPIAPLGKDVVTLFGRSGTGYTPTLLVAYGGIAGEEWFYHHYDIWRDERLQRYVPQGVVDRLGRIRDVLVTDDADWHHIDVAAAAKTIADAGGRVCLGGHGQLQGLGVHWEMWAFVQGGFTPHEALRVATLWPAEVLGLDKDLGSLEVGKLADFVVLEKDPLEKIENSVSVELVVKNGRAYTPEELARRIVH